MTGSAPTLLEIAEAPAAFVLPRHPAVVEGDGWLFLPMTHTTGAVQRIRLAPDRLEQAREETRALAAERGVPEIAWLCSAHTEPADLGIRLALEHRETLAALVLEHPVDDVAAFELRQVETLDDYIAAQTVDATAHGWPVPASEEYAAMWPTARERFLMWLALDDGAPVGMARCAVAADTLVMVGGAVLPEARGRGAYRTLVAARRRAADERGLRALVTAANDQSRPILERVGFERIGEIEVWVDEP